MREISRRRVFPAEFPKARDARRSLGALTCDSDTWNREHLVVVVVLFPPIDPASVTGIASIQPRLRLAMWVAWRSINPRRKPARYFISRHDRTKERTSSSVALRLRTRINSRSFLGDRVLRSRRKSLKIVNWRSLIVEARERDSNSANLTSRILLTCNVTRKCKYLFPRRSNDEENTADRYFNVSNSLFCYVSHL